MLKTSHSYLHMHALRFHKVLYRLQVLLFQLPHYCYANLLTKLANRCYQVIVKVAASTIRA